MCCSKYCVEIIFLLAMCSVRLHCTEIVVKMITIADLTVFTLFVFPVSLFICKTFAKAYR